MTDTIENLLAYNLHNVFGERDPAKRRAAIEALYAPDAVFFDPEGNHKGWDGVERAAATLQEATPGFAFSSLKDAQSLGSVAGRLHWAYGPAAEPAKSPASTSPSCAMAASPRSTPLSTASDASALPLSRFRAKAGRALDAKLFGKDPFVEAVAGIE